MLVSLTCWSKVRTGPYLNFSPAAIARYGYSTVTASTVRITDLISLHLGIVYVITNLNLKDHR